MLVKNDTLFTKILKDLLEQGEDLLKLNKEVLPKNSDKNINNKNNVEAYIILFKFENELRVFLKDKLRSIYSNEWIDKGLSKEHRNSAESYKNKVGKFFSSIEYDFPLEYLVFPFYHQILKKNLSQITGEDSKVTKNLEKKLSNLFLPLDELRIAIAHCVEISKEDLERFKTNTELIMNFLNKFKKIDKKQASLRNTDQKTEDKIIMTAKLYLNNNQKKSNLDILIDHLKAKHPFHSSDKLIEILLQMKRRGIVDLDDHPDSHAAMIKLI